MKRKYQNLQKKLTNITEKANSVDTVGTDQNEMKKELHDLKTKLLRHENSAVSCLLRINGIPYYKNENTYSLFSNMCTNLGIETPNVQMVQRMKNKNKSPAPTIIVKLMSPFDKNLILKTVSKYRRTTKDLLRLHLMNFDSINPFYVNESLSESNYKIFNKALQMRKNKILFSVFTKRGIVHIVKNESDTPMHIDHIEQLDVFFRSDGAITTEMQ